MVYNFGSCGTLSLHYKGIIISTFPLTKNKTLQYYIKAGESSILRHFQSGHSLKEQIEICVSYCELFTSRRYHKQKVSQKDHHIFLQALMVLLKTKQIKNDNDFGYFVMPYKQYIKKR
tara:strand:- start:122 stop:475 length:354 start_codon:yes stop_codon:yes gene_type:complete